MNYELIIIGGGPAGVSAGVYASRKQLKTALITIDFGGQSIVSDEIQNWIGTPRISGLALAKNMELHLREYAGEFLDIYKNEKVIEILENNEGFLLKTDRQELQTKTLLVATGSHRKKLDVEGAEKFENKGITYCASCDGPLFSGKDVVVIGGGNAGFESASQLLSYTKSVTLLNRTEEFKADLILVERLKKDPKMKIITNAILTKIIGEDFVSGLEYKDSKTDEIFQINTSGIFVEIGALPTTGFIKNLVELNSYGYIKTDPKTQRTTNDNIWAAGDCTDGLYHQNNIASGDGVKALENIYLHLRAKNN